MAPYIRYGENDTNGRKRHYPAKFGGKQRKLTRWQQKHRIITVPSTMNNYTDIHYIYDIDDPLSNITNGTATMLNNHFYRKKLLLGDMSARRSVGAQPLTTVIVIASIFLFITMSITAATVVFCKKKNTVFVLNKSEQDDNDYDLELEEMENTDVDFVEFNEDVDLSALEQQPATSSRRFCDDRASCKYEQDGYRRMVVSAVVEHETPRKSRGLYNNSSTTDSDLSLNGTSHGILNSKHPSAKDYRVDLEQMDSSRSHKLPGENPENVKELLRRLPLGAQTIQYINGKRYLVCELPERLANPTTDTKAVDTDLYGLQSEIDIQPDMSSIQGEISPQRRIDDTGFQDCDNELICDGLNDPYLSLGMSHSQSMGVLTNQPHDRNLRMSMSTDFKGGQESWKQ